MRSHSTFLTAFLLLLVLLPGAPGTLAAQDKSSDYTEPYQLNALEIYRTAIGFRTSAGHGQVPALAEYLAGEFRTGGFPDEDIHVLPQTTADGEQTASLVVRYRGDGTSGAKPILLLAHVDVVDALPEDWVRDPFTLTEESGFFFGRGTLDVKGGVSILTATFLRLKAKGFVPTRDLIIAFSGDEETGMLTARSLATTHRDLVDAAYALNADAGGGTLGPHGEAVSYLLQTSEKTYATFELTLRNPGGHSSEPRADNAIYELATVLKNIEDHRFPVRSNETTRQYFKASANVTDGPVGDAMRRFAANPDDTSASDVLAREPAYVGITRTTCVATMLRAGHAENALPQSATATVNCRIFPGVEVSEVRSTLARVADNDQLEIRVLGEPTASPRSELTSDVVSAVGAAVESRFPGTAVIPYMAAYGTDGREFRRAGIPTYGTMGIFIKSSDMFAHGLDERVPVNQFFGALEHWKTMLTELAGR